MRTVRKIHLPMGGGDYFLDCNGEFKRPLGLVGPQGPPGSIEKSWPVNSVFITIVSINPSILLDFGTWELLVTGRILGKTVWLWKRTI